MKDYISREAALVYAPLPKHLREYQTQNLDDAWEDGYFCALDQIRSIPAADVRPVERGKWLGTHDGFYYTYSCSECGYEALYKENTKDQVCSSFCPNCGADMREES